MLRLALLLALAPSAAPAAPPAATASPGAPTRTLRLDYVHGGKAGAQWFALDGVALERPWPGPPDGMLDTSGLGRSRCEVRDASSRTLSSRGFASIYGEWASTKEAKTVARAFHESVRFPAPAAAVTVVLSERSEGGPFEEVWSVPIDPAS